MNLIKMEFEIKKVELSKHDQKIGLTLPKNPSLELAEFMGIMVGDGYMNTYSGNKSYLDIAGDSSLDKDYLLNHASSLIVELFNIKPRIRYLKGQNSMYLSVTSKGLNNYLRLLGFVDGKKGQIKIPTWILSNGVFMTYFLKGLMDTDGCLSLINRNQKKSQYYPRIQIVSKSEPLILQIANWAKSQNVKFCLMLNVSKRTHKGVTKTHVAHRLNINGHKQVAKWMNLIGFRNKRHLDKHIRLKNGATGI